jgi:hypothetical protein
MSRDFGHLALALITLINVWIVFKDTVLRPFRGPGRSIRDHRAAPLLEILE